MRPSHAEAYQELPEEISGERMEPMEPAEPVEPVDTDVSEKLEEVSFFSGE